MTEQSPLERAARALCIAQGDEPDEFSNFAQKPIWACYTDQARAVIEAIRLPSEAMVGDGLSDWCQSPDEPDLDVIGIWKAMIDAALDSMGN